MTKEYIEREKVIEVIKNYGKNAIDIGHSSLDPVDDIILLQGAVNMIPAADVVENTDSPKTNYDRIRNMSVDELAEFLDDMQTDALFLEGKIQDLKYPTDWKEYLESEDVGG